MELFDGTENLATSVNREFRILLKTYLSYRTRFDGFLDQVSEDFLDTVRRLVTCDVDLETDFQREVERDMQRARGCIGDVGGEQTPAPTM